MKICNWAGLNVNAPVGEIFYQDMFTLKMEQGLF
jgi:hypothetical protein